MPGMWIGASRKERWDKAPVSGLRANVDSKDERDKIRDKVTRLG